MRYNWPKRAPRNGRAPCVAVVAVNYNTKHLLARLIFSLRRILDGQVRLGPIVVVDNHSTDGSVELIRHMAARKIVHGLFNQQQAYHGPGLNQGMDYLRRQVSRGHPDFAGVDYVFVVDSDVIITKGEVFDLALDALLASGACMAGEVHDNQPVGGGYVHVSSLLLDPVVTWRRGIHPFEEHGTPALTFQQSTVRNKLPRLHFPLRAEFFLIHLWSGTLKAICAQKETHNKYFDWAAADLASRPPVDTATASILEEFEQVFQAETGTGDPARIAEACLKPARIRLVRPYELAPTALNRQILKRPGPGFVLWADSPFQKCPA